jgi:hypothetical protein
MQLLPHGLLFAGLQFGWVPEVLVAAWPATGIASIPARKRALIN